jgi:hypothetical protein
MELTVDGGLAEDVSYTRMNCVRPVRLVAIRAMSTIFAVFLRGVHTPLDHLTNILCSIHA